MAAPLDTKKSTTLDHWTRSTESQHDASVKVAGLWILLFDNHGLSLHDFALTPQYCYHRCWWSGVVAESNLLVKVAVYPRVPCGLWENMVQTSIVKVPCQRRQPLHFVWTNRGYFKGLSATSPTAVRHSGCASIQGPKHRYVYISIH